MLRHRDNVKVHVYQWWWWFRPRAWYLVPSIIACVIICQTLVAILHYNNVIDDRPLTGRQAVPESVAISSPANDYDPQSGVAFAIPVGGRTERSKQLAHILDQLIDGGALPDNIYVFEDVLSRWDGKPSKPVGEVANKRGVAVIESRVDRSRHEDASNFGIGLARHYHFFLDFLFADSDTPDVVRRVERANPYDFALVIEDDLDVSPDLVKFFFSMSRVMLADDTLYCAAAHQDNAFLGIHRDDTFDPSIHRATQLNSDGFDFRRGNHFMAPGWMTSQTVYLDIVRPKWMDASLEYSHKSELHLRNGHWDRFFDSMIRDKDCIFPEIPRITHQGADGFTVSKRGQMELYSNLRLAQLPVTVSYGDLSRLTRQGYIGETETFILAATKLTVLEEARKYRHAKLVYVVDTNDDKDEEWNAVINNYFGLIGVGGYGGYEGYVKVRGIFRGAVFVRWLTNLILLVGSYSPYMEQVKLLNQQLVTDDGLEIEYLGCYTDDWNRDLPYLIKHYTARSLTPRKCLLSCQYNGFQYAGLQRHECWCGSKYGQHGQSNSAKDCDHQCGNNGLLSSLLSSSQSSDSKNPMHCGGGWRNSVYTNSHPETKNTYALVMKPPSELVYVKGEPGESCDDACSKRGGNNQRCDERYFPLIHRSCSMLGSIFGAECSKCVDEEEPERGFATPAYDLNGQVCLLSRARYHRCDWQPPAPLIRACTCVA